MDLAKNLAATSCPVLIGNRKAYFRAQGQGLAVQEFAPQDKAAEEVKCLYTYIRNTLYNQGKANDGKAREKFSSSSA